VRGLTREADGDLPGVLETAEQVAPAAVAAVGVAATGARAAAGGEAAQCGGRQGEAAPSDEAAAVLHGSAPLAYVTWSVSTVACHTTCVGHSVDPGIGSRTTLITPPRTCPTPPAFVTLSWSQAAVAAPRRAFCGSSFCDGDDSPLGCLRHAEDVCFDDVSSVRA